MTEHNHPVPKPLSTFSTPLAIGLIIAAYGLAVVLGLPQHATALILDHGVTLDQVVVPTEDEPGEPHHATPAVHSVPPPPPLFMITPFVLLLGAIAVFPLLHVSEHFWESNRNKLLVAGGLGLCTLLYYLAFHPHAVERHFLGHGLVPANEGGLNWHLSWQLVQNSIFGEYIPFMVLLFSLYTIAGGLRIEGDLPAHPGTNTCFMGAGALLASFIGTTGASMLLIRPLLETNRERKHVKHTAVFFIFVVCNCGGLLLPLGDPPLFLGYLQGVDFLWTMRLIVPWILVNASLLGIYYLWDRFVAYPQESAYDLQRDETQVRRLKFSGTINFVWLLGVVLSVALLIPEKPFLGTNWHPWLYLREVLQLTFVALSLVTTPAAVRKANQFNYGAIIEVAALFIGIFLCMQPALQILNASGAQLGLSTPTHFFWATGILSSVLDNAPTYLVFFQAASVLPDQGAHGPLMAGVPMDLLAAISLGAVFMGAMTYIGNGPNFMVKAIAEKSGVAMPSFFGYMVYSCLVLLPILIAVTLFIDAISLWVIR